MLDYGPRIAAYSEDRDRLEMSFVKTADSKSADGRWDLTQSSFKKACEATKRWTKRAQATPLRQNNKWIYKHYWEKQNSKAGIDVR